MKLRITGFLLGILVMLSVVAPASAAVCSYGDYGALVESPFYVNGEQIGNLEFWNVSGVNYVTVESFVNAMGHRNRIETADDQITVNSSYVVGIVATVNEYASLIEETLDLTAKVGQSYVVANDRCLYVEGKVLEIGSKPALPIRVLAEIYNMDVEYDSATRCVYLTRREDNHMYIQNGSEVYDSDALYWLSHIINAESGNQSMVGKLAVGNVVMNRVASDRFPNTIYGVLFQKNQFSPAMTGSIYCEPTNDSVAAAKMILEGVVVLEDALFFNRVGMNTYAARNRAFAATIGGHSFYN